MGRNGMNGEPRSGFLVLDDPAVLESVGSASATQPLRPPAKPWMKRFWANM